MSELCRLRRREKYGACIDEAMVERRGKSSPDGVEAPIAVNSIRSNAVEGHKGRPGRPGEAAGARWQQRVETDGCLKRQNPAYRLTATRRPAAPVRDGGSLF